VSGVPALTANGFATWTAQVPLDHGRNELVASITDQQGQLLERGATVFVTQTGWALRSSIVAATDTLGNELLLSDEDAVAAVDLETGEARLISGSARGSGPTFYFSEAIAADPAHGRVFVVGGETYTTPMSIDLATGDRSLLPRLSDDAATDLDFCRGLALDSEGKVGYAVRSFDDPAVIAVDLTTGARSVVSGASIGAGEAFDDPLDVVYDAVTDPLKPRLLVTEPQLQQILAVDLDTGDREVFSSAAPRGQGVALDAPLRLALDASHGRLIVTDAGAERLVAVDLDTGDRTTLADDVTGQGPLESMFGLALDPEGARAFLPTRAGGQIIAVDLSSLERSIFSSTNLGAGPHLVDPRGLAFAPGDDGEPDVLYTADGSLEGVFRIDLRTSDRSEVSGPNVGAGPSFERALDIAIDSTSHATSPRLLVTDQQLQALVAVELATGNRALVSGPSIGSGSLLKSPWGVAINPADQQVVVLDSPVNESGVLFGIDLASGDRTLLSGDARGTGPAFTWAAHSVIFDTSSSAARVLVGDSQLFGIFSVDLATGDRTELAPLSTPGDIMLDPDRERVIALDYHENSLVSVTLQGAEVTLLSGEGKYDAPDKGRGPPLSLPFSFTANLDDQVAFVASAELGAILAVDLATGERVVISR
jgi:DNA-binding beta-propeller fold protein YncE